MTGPMPRWLQLLAVLSLGGAGVWLVRSAKRPRRRKRGLRGWQEDAAKAEVRRIASTSKTAEEYARRVEAWNASEAKPLSLTLLAKGWAGGRQASKVMELLRQAREQRLTGRERLWSRMSEGLKGKR